MGVFMGSNEFASFIVQHSAVIASTVLYQGLTIAIFHCGGNGRGEGRVRNGNKGKQDLKKRKKLHLIYFCLQAGAIRD